MACHGLLVRGVSGHHTGSSTELGILEGVRGQLVALLVALEADLSLGEAAGGQCGGQMTTTCGLWFKGMEAIGQPSQGNKTGSL